MVSILDLEINGKQYMYMNKSLGCGNFGCTFLYADKNKISKLYVIKIIYNNDAPPVEINVGEKLNSYGKCRKDIQCFIGGITIDKEKNPILFEKCNYLLKTIEYKRDYFENVIEYAIGYKIIISEYISGIDLMTYINNNLSLKKIFNIEKILISILNSVNFLHKISISHNDISVNNIIIDNNTNPVLIDFGNACIVNNIKSCTDQMSTDYKNTYKIFRI